MISIIGAGPSGNHLAFLLAKRGMNVEVYEDHKVIGKPIQCTGIVTKSFGKFVKLQKHFVINTVRRAQVFSPKMDKIELKLEDNIIVDRHKFDKYMADKAIDHGVKYHLNHRFNNYQIKDGIRFSVSNNTVNKLVRCDQLVGADGPFSRVAKSAGLLNGRKYINALQVRARYESDKSVFQIYLDKNFFGWIVPESNTIARIGMTSIREIGPQFERFLGRFINEKDKIEYQSGLVPLYNPWQKFQNGNVYLVGDAAGQAKASTHGGIIQGLIAAEELSTAIVEGKNYNILCNQKLGLDLKLHLLIRASMDKFSNNDLNYLVKLTGKRETLRILSKYDRDYPSKFLAKVLLNEPRFLYFLKNLDYSLFTKMIKKYIAN